MKQPKGTITNQNHKIIFSLFSHPICLSKPVLKNPLQGSSYRKDELEKKKNYVDQILEGIKANPYLNDNEKKQFLEAKQYLIENDWINLEGCFERLRYLRICYDKPVLVPRYRAFDRTLYLNDIHQLPDHIYLPMIKGIKGFDDLNQIYARYERNIYLKEEAFYRLFHLLVLLIGMDSVKGAFTTGNAMMLVHKLMIQKNHKKAIYLLNQICGYYHYRDLDENRIEKIVCTEDAYQGLKEVYDAMYTPNIAFEEAYEKGTV